MFSFIHTLIDSLNISLPTAFLLLHRFITASYDIAGLKAFSIKSSADTKFNKNKLILKNKKLSPYIQIFFLKYFLNIFIYFQVNFQLLLLLFLLHLLLYLSFFPFFLGILLHQI